MDMYLLKFPYRKILLPLAKKLKFIDPDLISYAATIVAFVTMFCYLLCNKNPTLLLLSVAFTFLRMSLNTIDGVIAIERGNMRLKGEIVNALPDRYSDIFILIGIALSPFCSPLLGIIGLSSMFLVSYTGMLSKAIGAQWQHHGPLGKVERLIFIMIFSILQYLNIIGKISNPNLLGHSFTYFELCMILFAVLGQITVFNRLKTQLKEAEILDWEKYRDLKDKKVLVMYDTLGGSTKKVADSVTSALCADIVQVGENVDTSIYDLVIFLSPNISRKPTKKFIEYFNNNKICIKNYAVIMTAGMPLYRYISTPPCFEFFEEKLGKKPVAKLLVKAKHTIAKTFPTRPNQTDLLNSYLFAVKTIGGIQNV